MELRICHRSEIGLRAKLRQTSVIHSSTNLYGVPSGTQTVPTPSSTHAAWNYEFAIDLQPSGGTGTLTLGDIVASLKITDLTTSATATVNPLTYWGDDDGWGSSGKTIPENAAEWGAENSENPRVADFPLAAGYDVNAHDTY